MGRDRVAELGIAYSHRKKMQLHRSLQFVALRRQYGAGTRAGMRGIRARGSCRNDGGAANSLLAPGLRHCLLQYFVDHVQRWQSRADSCMMLAEARHMRNALLFAGWKESDLPKLEGNAGAQWFKRWRAEYGIVKRGVLFHA